MLIKKLLFLLNCFNHTYTNSILLNISKESDIIEKLYLINLSIERKFFFDGLNLGGSFLLNNFHVTEIGINNFNIFLSYKIYTNEFEYFNFNFNLITIFAFNKKILKDIVIKLDFYNVFMYKYFHFSIDLFILNQQISVNYYGFVLKKNFKIYTKLNLMKILDYIKGENLKTTQNEERQNIYNNFDVNQKNDLEKLKDALEVFDATYNENKHTISFNLNEEKKLPEEIFSVEEFFKKSEKLKNRVNNQYKYLSLKYHPDKNYGSDKEKIAAEDNFKKVTFVHDHFK